MAEEQQQQGSKMPKVGTLVAGFFAFFILMFVIGGIGGCFDRFDLGAAIGFGGDDGQNIFKNECSIAFMSVGVSIAGWWLGLMGTLFDYSILAFVVSMGSLLGKGSPFASGIQIGWGILRDLVNLVFIIGLIYAAISLILRINVSKIGELIIRILVAALLVNFSYFFVAVIIDASNFVSAKIYEEAIYSGERVPLGRLNPFSAAQWQFGQSGLVAPVSERFMAITKLGSLYNIEFSDFQDGGQFGDNQVYPYIIAGAGAILFSLTGAIFATAAVFLIIRFIVILLLLITSPVGILYFVGVPKLAEWGKAWWNTLFAQALFPIVFLLMVGVSFKVLEEGVATTSFNGSGSFYALIVGAGDPQIWYQNIHLIFIFLIAFGLLYLSIQIASSVAQQKAFTPPTPAGLFKLAQQTQKLAQLTFPRSLLYRATTWGVGKAGEAAGGTVAGRAVGRAAGAVGSAITAPFKGPEARVAKEAEDIRKQRLKDIAAKNPADITKDDRDEWGKAPERLRGEVIRENPKLRKNIAQLEAGAFSVKSPEKKAETEEPKQKPASDATTTSAASSDSQQRIEQVLQTLQRTEARELGLLKQLTTNELAQTMIARRDFLDDAPTARRLADTVGDRFDEALLSLPVNQITTKTANAVGGQIRKLQTYSALRGRLGAPERSALDAAVERDNPGMRRLFNTSPGGMF